jgi:hypothetical protein
MLAQLFPTTGVVGYWYVAPPALSCPAHCLQRLRTAFYCSTFLSALGQSFD